MKERIHPAGERVGKYEIVDHLASGGFAAIYEARDEDGERVAVKTSRFDPVETPRPVRRAQADRLAREYDVLELCEHPLVVSVHGFDWNGGDPLLAMELLEGPTLLQAMTGLRKPLRSWLEAVANVAEALAHVHDQGFIHRDVTPSNIMLSRVGAKLIDFGVVQPLSRAYGPALTGPGEVLGTAEYVSPSYAAYLLAREADTQVYRAEPSDDVHALGVLLYQVLTGRLPTWTPSSRLVALLEEIRDGVPVDPREINPKAPPRLSELARVLLSKRSSERPAKGSTALRLVREAMEEDAPFLFVPSPAYEAGLELALAGELLEPRRARDNEAQPAGQYAVAMSSSPPQPTSPDAAPQEAPASTLQPSAENREAPNPTSLGGWRTRLRRMATARTAGLVLAAVTGIVVLAQNTYVSLVNRETSRNNARTAEALAQLEAARAVNKSAPGALPDVPGAAVGKVLSGLPMPAEPDPSWMRPPCVKGGRRMSGVTVLRQVCWEVTVNPSYIGDGPREPCPDIAYDPPPEASAEQKRFCFRPVIVKTGQAVAPERSRAQ